MMERPSKRLAIGVGGFLFIIALGVGLNLRRLALGEESAVVISDGFVGDFVRLMVIGALFVPAAHLALHRISRPKTGAATRQAYRRSLLMPQALSLLALPLLAIRPVSSDAAMVLASNVAMAAADLLILLWLRGVPGTALIREDKERIFAYRD